MKNAPKVTSSSPVKDERPGRFDFLGVAKYIVTASIILTLTSLTIILTKGFAYGVDFAGGTEIQVQFSKPVDAGQVRAFTSAMGFPNAAVQAYGGNNEYLIRMETAVGKTDKETNEIMKETIDKMKNGLSSHFVNEGAEIRKVDTVGPQRAELKKNGRSWRDFIRCCHLIYVGLRFEYKYMRRAPYFASSMT